MSVQIRHLTTEHYAVSQWSGGSTTQIAIGPDHATYADGTFLWRISSATVILPKSTFTPLPDYMRYISVLRGDMELTHGTKEPIALAPYGIHLFDGGTETNCVGKCVDFNLMLRKDACEGSLRAVQLPEEGVVTFSTQYTGTVSGSTLVVYCVEGGGTITLENQATVLLAGESILVSHMTQTEGSIACQQSSGFMIAQMNTKI